MSKQILLGVTGGIAAYKAADLLRKMGKKSWSVQVVMTEAATQFMGTMTMQALSGKTVFTEAFDARMPNIMPHIELSKGSNAIVIAPATADCIAKLAQGLASDLLSALCLARDCPLIIAPAMNCRMWRHPATQRNIEQLKADGVIVIGPDTGELACREQGDGRMLDVDILLDAIDAQLSKKSLAGKRVLVTAGPTVEQIDPVRAITNQSSGKMGYAIAHAANAAGAQVTLVSGPTALATPYGVRRIDVQSAQDMLDAVMPLATQSDIFISVAAVSDYRVENTAKSKIKKENDSALTLTLLPNPDILATVSQLADPPFCVGFAAETDNLIDNAQTKRQKKQVPMMIVNDAQTAIGSDHNLVNILEDTGITPLGGPTEKGELAHQIIEKIADRISQYPDKL